VRKTRAVHDSVRGQLLVATPELQDPNFIRTVVLVLEHSPEGALGLVLNRPTDTLLSGSLPAWADLGAAPAVVYVGGPVQPEAAIGLGRRAGDTDPEGFAPLFGDLGTVDLERDPREVAPRVDAVRVYVGYSGWGPGQLDGELAADGWYVVDALPEDPWSSRPDSLWRGVLRRQSGPLRLVAGFPADPSMN
jgi:putative transcriptional regulator